MDLFFINEEVKFPSANGGSQVSQNIKIGNRDFFISVLRYQIFDEKNKFYFLTIDINQGVIYFLKQNSQNLEDANVKIKEIFGDKIKLTQKTISNPAKPSAKINAFKWSSGQYKNIQIALSAYFKKINSSAAGQSQDNKTQETQNNTQQTLETLQFVKDKFANVTNTAVETKLDDIIAEFKTNKDKIEISEEQKNILKILINYLFDDDIRNILFMKLKISKDNYLGKIMSKLKNNKKTPEDEKNYKICEIIEDLILELNIKLTNKTIFWTVIKKNISDLKYFYEGEDNSFYKEIKDADLFFEKYIGKK